MTTRGNFKPKSSKMSSSLFLATLSLLLVAFFSYTTLATFVGGNETDRLALLAFKSSILQDPQGVMASWNESLHFCQWEGVGCGHKHKRVVFIHLISKGLVGSLSSHIGNLTFLRDIQLFNNTLKGRIPPQLGQLFRLQSLDLRMNAFEGEIPANISHCSNLLYLYLDFNPLVGHIPKELGSLSKLEFLTIQSTNVTGEIPPSIGNLTSLIALLLVSNNLVGTLPSSLGQLMNLVSLFAGVNSFTGTVPQQVYNISSLRALSLAYNNFEGSLPQDIGFTLPQLSILQLTNNSFSGPLPSSLSNASNMFRIDIPRNKFTGKIAIDFGRQQILKDVSISENYLGTGDPDELSFLTSLANCTQLDVLDLASNQLKGSFPYNMHNFSKNFSTFTLAGNHIFGDIPSWLGDIVGLSALSLAENSLTGTIPANLGNLRNLERFTLANNKLTGEIPSSLGNLLLLNELSLNDNRLQGNIPLRLGKCHQLSMLDLSQNNLSGSIPEQLFDIPALSILLNLSRNNLSGSLPKEVGNLKNLAALDLSENGFSAEIPNSLGSCKSLLNLQLRGNFFQGSIAAYLSSLHGIEILDLSDNNFSGQIPEYLETFSLGHLNLSYNQFQGRVPIQGIFANASLISVAGNKGLCGGIPDLKLPRCTTSRVKATKMGLSRIRLVQIILPSAFLTVIAMAGSLYCWLRGKPKVKSTETLLKEAFLHASYDMLLKATDGFSSANLLGVGGFGSVYKGILDHDEQTVAVKVINLSHRSGLRSFISECEVLRNVRHRNLLRIITACSSIDFQGNDFMALVYEFMPNGSLESWIHSARETDDEQVEPRTLNLHQRIRIAIDVASALEYLHHGCGTPIVHCDLKPSNILLDADMVAHVGDFGLAKLLLCDLSGANQSSSIGIRGTVGYAPPEYGLGSEVSTKGDVYSYGIFLLEMITGLMPTDPMFEGDLNLHNYAKTSVLNSVTEIIDPILLHNNEYEEDRVASVDSRQTRLQVHENIRKECLISMIKLGVACSMESPQDRMEASDVVLELQKVGKVLQGQSQTSL